MVFVVYALSPGPVVRLLYHSRGSSPPAPSPAAERCLDLVYLPIIFVADHVPYVSEFYEWYFELWGVG
jgi:hypothetical protein